MSRPDAAAVTLGGRRFELAVLATERARRAVHRALAALPDGHGALLLWPRERFCKLETAGLPGRSYDVVFLDRSGKIVDRGELDRANPEGVVPRVEASAALIVARGGLATAGLHEGDAAALENLPAAEDLPLLRIGGAEARVEVPVTAEECRHGLMFRPRLSADDGMFFDNEVEQPGLSAWMKNTLLPLDIAFFRADGTLLNVAETPPAADPRAGPWPSAQAAGPARFALEMNLGWFKKQGLVSADGRVKPGTRAQLPPRGAE